MSTEAQNYEQNMNEAVAISRVQVLLMPQPHIKLCFFRFRVICTKSIHCHRLDSLISYGTICIISSFLSDFVHYIHSFNKFTKSSI